MTLFDTLELRDRNALVDAIQTSYAQQGYVVISFLYFANLMKGRLLEGTPKLWQQRYHDALVASDFLLADGIALQVFYRYSSLGRKNKCLPPNHNGTDFIPYFFEQYLPTQTQAHVALLMFRDESIGKGENYAQLAQQVFMDRFGVSFGYIWQTNFAKRASFEFDRDAYEQTLHDDDSSRIMFVCLGTPTQEIRIEKHRKKIQQYGCIVLNAGGTIDYMTGLEQRAPARVVKARVLETLRRITIHPKKNLKKFLAMFGIVRYRWFLCKEGLKK